jgi:hypothetical protein
LKEKIFFNKSFSTIFATQQKIATFEKKYWVRFKKYLAETNCMKNPARAGFFLLLHTQITEHLQISETEPFQKIKAFFFKESLT